LFFLGFCRGQGDVLIVGINSDEYILKNKRGEFKSFEERKAEILSLGPDAVSEVVEFSESEPSGFILKVMPDVHCIAEEYRGCAPEEDFLRSRDISIVYVPRVGEWSTTGIKGG